MLSLNPFVYKLPYIVRQYMFARYYAYANMVVQGGHSLRQIQTLSAWIDANIWVFIGMDENLAEISFHLLTR